MKILKYLLALSLVLSPLPAVAQSSASQDIIGFLTTSGCLSGQSVCFKQYDGTNPLPISGSFSATLAGFTPTAGATAALSVTSSSSDVALPAGTDDVITNTGANTVLFRVQAGAGTALTTDYALPSGLAVGIHAGTATHLSAITASSTSSLNIQGGSGLAGLGYGGSGSSGGGNSTIIGPLGSALSAVSVSVVIASDQASVSVKQATAANLNATVVGTGTLSVQNTAATPAGTNLIGSVNLQPTTSGGSTMYTGSITNTAVAVDASAGQVYGYYFYNSNSSVCYVQFYNTAQGSVTVGTTPPVLSLGIPATGGANVAFPNGIAYSTAITIAATTTRAGGTGCSNNVDANVLYK